MRKYRLGAVAIRTKLDLGAGAGKTVIAQVTENHGLGLRDLARCAPVGDHELNTFLLRADAVSEVDGIEPGIMVWLDTEDKSGSRTFPPAGDWA